MPRPAEAGRRYLPGLDGLRALAVLAVIAYHLNLGWAKGGMLGVGVFFTLSGYLITGLLLGSWERSGSLELRRFWLRRARRLLPALFVMLAAVSVWVALFDAAQLAAVRTQVLAAAAYAGNWSTIAGHGSYFARFAPPLPLDHLWSLAIEEQFYLVWPWLVLAGIWTLRSRRLLAFASLELAAISALAMALLHHPGYDPTRVYEGTDTRAFGLLVGAALAFVWPGDRSAVRGARRDLLDAIGLAGLAGILALFATTDSYAAILYPGGFVLLSVATAATIACVAHPATRVGGALGWAPLRWVGVRSYGIYLWHWPLIVLSRPAAGPAPVTAAAQVAATIAIAALSWRYVEEPIRQGGLGRLWREVRGSAQRVPRRALAASSAALGVVVAPVLGLVGVLPATSTRIASSGGTASAPAPLSAPAAAGDPRAPDAHARTPTRTSCRRVVYVGDSTSEGEISTAYIPRPGRRLDRQLARVGVRSSRMEISGARSIVEGLPGQTNAASVAQALRARGFHGCWILALGTNDTADVYVGSTVGQRTRIARMMSIIGDQPVLWLDVISTHASGAYSEGMMERWNRALLAACRRHPTMRIYDWASQARPRWFIADGIHYTSPGYEQRAHLTARALVSAFPAGRPPSRGCVVR